MRYYLRKLTYLTIIHGLVNYAPIVILLAVERSGRFVNFGPLGYRSWVGTRRIGSHHGTIFRCALLPAKDGGVHNEKMERALKYKRSTSRSYLLLRQMAHRTQSGGAPGPYIAGTLSQTKGAFTDH